MKSPADVRWIELLIEAHRVEVVSDGRAHGADERLEALSRELLEREEAQLRGAAEGRGGLGGGALGRCRFEHVVPCDNVQVYPQPEDEQHESIACDDRPRECELFQLTPSLLTPFASLPKRRGKQKEQVRW